MEVKTTSIEGVVTIRPRVFGDHRGFFLESFSRPLFEKQGLPADFVQDNHAKSSATGVLRGLHFQLPPFTQTKLVRVTRGAVYDVVVDLRKKSPTFGRWEGFELAEENFMMLLIPKGLAHGYCTLRPDTEFMYKVDAPYAPQYDAGVLWNDPGLAITWPVENPILSDKDQALPTLREFESPF